MRSRFSRKADGPALALIAVIALNLVTATAVAEGFSSALQAVLDNHPAIGGKVAEVAAKGYAIDTAEAMRYPSLSTQIGYNDQNETTGVLQLQQPLWAFGKIDRPIAHAATDKIVGEADLLRIRRELLQQTASAYANIEGLRQKIAVSGASVTQLSSLYGQIERRRQGQLASTADVKLAHTRLLQGESQYQRMQSELKIALNELYALTQTEVESQSPISRERLWSAGDGGQTVAELIEQITPENGTIRYKTAQLALAHRAHDSSAVTHLPTLLLQVDHDILDSAGVYDNDTRLMLLLEGSLEGGGFAVRSRTGATAAHITAVQQDLMQSRNDLARQITSLHQNRQMQQQLHRSQAQSVAALEDIADSYMRQYEAGRKSWLEVLNMRRELTEQRLQWVTAENGWLQATLKLMALGRGLEQLATQTDLTRGVDSTISPHQ